MEAAGEGDEGDERRGWRHYVRDGWELGGDAYALALKHRELRRFAAPAYGAVILVEVAAAVAVLAVRHHGSLLERGLAALALAYLAALLSNLAAVGLAGLSDRALSGREVEPREGWRLMGARFPQVVGWSAIVVAIGVPSRLLTSWGVDQLAAVLLGFGWTVLSFFAVPAIALLGDGPVEAGMRSLRLVGRSWGEQVVGMVYVWLRPAIFVGLPGVVAVAVGVTLDLSGLDFLGWAIAVGGVLAIAIAYLLLIAADSILSVALFRFARGEPVPEGFDEQRLGRVLRSPAPLVVRTVRRLEGERTRSVRERLRSAIDPPG